MKHTHTAIGLALLALLGLSVGCNEENVSTETAYSETDDLVKIGGKFDTGYYSSLAMELEGTFEGTIELDVTELSDDEREDLQDPTVLRLIAENQVKMAKNQLNEKRLHLNLTAGEVLFDSQEVVERDEGAFLVATFTVKAESLVTYTELEEVGINPLDLEDTSHEVTVPADPRHLFHRAGESCAAGHSQGSLHEGNYFYYFEPTLETCLIPMAPTAAFHVHSLLPQEETFPEYDRLTADGRLDMAIIFGAYTNTEPPLSDWGVMMWRSYAADLRISGWEEVPGLEMGQRYQRERAGLLELIDLYSPTDLYNLQDTDGTFAELLKTREVIVYNGHSFYGSLNAMDDGANYPEDTYQILFMNSCWSYEYYTKQVFTHKATEADPTGWNDADVINNTTYAYFPQMSTSTRKLMTNLIAGAENGGVDDYGRRFSWQSIIGIMNDEARGVCPEDADSQDCRHYQPKSAHEIYGVSGVRTNVYTP